MKYSLILLSLMLLTNCAVEAGNPSTGGKGTLTISFASVTDAISDQFALTGNSRFEMNLEGLQISGYQNSNDIYEEIGLSESTIDLLTENTDNLVPLVTAVEITSGVYSSTVLSFNTEAPLKYTDPDGNENPITFSDSSHSSFTLTDSFEVNENETTEVIVNLDAFNSITKGDDQKFRFNPRADVMDKHRGVKHEGTYSGSDGDTVCAYLYDAHKPSPPPTRPGEDTRPPADRPAPPPPPPGPNAEGRPEFETKSDVVMDETKECTNGFDRAKVGVDGTYVFWHLRPGSYDFRLFKSDGSYTTVKENIVLDPPERSH